MTPGKIYDDQNLKNLPAKELKIHETFYKIRKLFCFLQFIERENDHNKNRRWTQSALKS